MTLEDLHRDGYRVVKALTVSGYRGTKSAVVLSKIQGDDYPHAIFLSWSFDTTHYTRPLYISGDGLKKFKS